MLRSRQLLTQEKKKERLAGLYLLFTVHIHKFSLGEAATQDPSENPFLPMLADAVLGGGGGSAQERCFVAELFAAQKNLAVQTVAAVMAALPRVAPPVSPDVAGRVAAALAAFRQKEEGVSGLAGAWKRSALGRAVNDGGEPPRERPLREVVDGDGGPPPASTDEATLLVQARHLAAAGGFEPRWIRPAPPRCEGEAGEIAWMDVDALAFEVLWDAGMGAEDPPVEELRNALAAACCEPLGPAMQKQLLERVDEVPGWLAHSGLTPERLPDLVENNAAVAFEILLKLMSSDQVTEYLSVLVNMEMTLQSMEVVNRLTTAVDLPTEFIHRYISNGIASCRTLSDKFNQTRLVRLVCVFLQSLIRNKIVDVEELFEEVQSFCLEFIKVREAAGLFKMLKTLESDPSAQIDEGR
jgi:hypothetical protein